MRRLATVVSLGAFVAVLSIPVAAATAGVRDGCEANYIGACVPPLPPDLDCDDIGVPLRVIGTDWHKLDADGDGIACEQFGTPPPLPDPSVPTPTTAPQPTVATYFPMATSTAPLPVPATPRFTG